MALGADFQQEVDLGSLFKDVASLYPPRLSPGPDSPPGGPRDAHRQGRGTVTCIILPNDVQEMDAVEQAPRGHGASFTGWGIASRTSFERRGLALLEPAGR